MSITAGHLDQLKPFLSEAIISSVQPARACLKRFKGGTSLPALRSEIRDKSQSGTGAYRAFGTSRIVASMHLSRTSSMLPEQVVMREIFLQHR